MYVRESGNGQINDIYIILWHMKNMAATWVVRVLKEKKTTISEAKIAVSRMFAKSYNSQMESHLHTNNNHRISYWP